MALLFLGTNPGLPSLPGASPPSDLTRPIVPFPVKWPSGVHDPGGGRWGGFDDPVRQESEKQVRRFFLSSSAVPAADATAELRRARDRDTRISRG